MKKNIFLFNWQEKFLLYEELKKRKKAFAEKYGIDNIFEFKSNEINVWEIFNAIFSGGLFVSKKLIIIFGIPKDTDTDNKITESKYTEFETKFMNNFESIPDDVIICFVSFTPDKRIKLYKFLSENITLKNYEKLKESELRNFIKQKLGDSIWTEEIQYFIELVGDDLFFISNEINKLSFFAREKNTKISKKIIDEVVYPKAVINSFTILDNMFFDKKRTLDLLQNIQDNWWDNFQFLWMLYWGLKAVIQIIDFVERGIKESKTIAEKLKLHPFVVAKNMKIIDKLITKKDNIKNMFEKLIMLDYNIKTWKVPQEIFWLEIKNIIISI